MKKNFKKLFSKIPKKNFLKIKKTFEKLFGKNILKKV